VPPNAASTFAWPDHATSSSAYCSQGEPGSEHDEQRCRNAADGAAPGAPPGRARHALGAPTQPDIEQDVERWSLGFIWRF
jgi:hypothetical protein